MGAQLDVRQPAEVPRVAAPLRPDPAAAPLRGHRDLRLVTVSSVIINVIIMFMFIIMFVMIVSSSSSSSIYIISSMVIMSIVIMYNMFNTVIINMFIITRLEHPCRRPGGALLVCMLVYYT